MEQHVTPFDLVLIEQRNQAMNEVAFWRSKATELDARIKELEQSKVEDGQN